MRLEDLWWRLPGPRGFLDEVARNLEAGRTVVLCVPPGQAAGLEGALMALVHDETSLAWKRLDFSPTGTFAEVAAEALIPLVRRPPRALPADIARDDGLRTAVLFVTGIQGRERFREFAVFLAGFLAEVARRDSARSPRLVFSVPQDTLEHQSLPVCNDIAGTVAWRGRVASADMQLFAAALMRGRPLFGPTMLYERVVGELAGWDPAFACELAEWAEPDLLEPWSALLKRAESWDARPVAWSNGSLDALGCRALEHTLNVVSRNDEEEIQRRLWRAHLAEIFPWLEELRLEFLIDFRSELKLPHLDQRGNQIDDIDALELSQIYWNLRHAANVPQQRLAALSLCRDIRHDLAHQRPISAMRLMRLENWWRRRQGK
jgi:hypothetical protein